ncbi:MAG: hypothetical protein ACE37J_00905 [Pikeienuella sp.]|uniref:hypothetical protein n=1 Tax=Pikeienuella sp. TaxID=2831957 RepID=UPI0039190CF4
MRRAAAFAALLFAAPAAAEPISFIAIGDMPNGDPEIVLPAYEALIDVINARDPALVIHVGDVKAVAAPCSDEALREQAALLGRIAAPVLFTPGDNDWTDCHLEAAGAHDPRERLAFLRAAFFGEGRWSRRAEPEPLERQAKAGFPENTRLRPGPILFVTLHVVGSNNGFESRNPEAVAEFFAREAAALAWLEESFAVAGDAAAVVVALHADMFAEGFEPFPRERWQGGSGFARIGPALRDAALAYGKPVLLIHGDGHVFGLDRPLRRTAPNLFALEVFGAPDMHGVEITADPARREVFSFAPILNPAQPR